MRGRVLRYHIRSGMIGNQLFWGSLSWRSEGLRRALGSDYIVVGRPITAAADPVAAYERCLKEFVD